jgi:hypothetical protein
MSCKDKKTKCEKLPANTRNLGQIEFKPYAGKQNGLDPIFYQSLQESYCCAWFLINGKFKINSLLKNQHLYKSY